MKTIKKTKFFILLVICLSFYSNVYSQSFFESFMKGFVRGLTNSSSGTQGSGGGNVLSPYERNLNKNNFTTTKELLYVLEIGANTGRNGRVNMEYWTLYFDNPSERDRAVQYFRNAKIPHVQQRGTIRNPNYTNPQNDTADDRSSNYGQFGNTDQSNSYNPYQQEPLYTERIFTDKAKKENKHTNIGEISVATGQTQDIFKKSLDQYFQNKPENPSGFDQNTTVAIRDDYPVLQAAEGTSREEINQYQEERIKKRENEQKDFEKQLEGMRASMTDEQYYIILTTMYAENGNIRPEYVGSRNGEYFFRCNDNTVYSICPNPFFSFVTMNRKNMENPELKEENAYSVITSSGKLLNLTNEKTIDGNIAWKNDPLETSQGFEVSANAKKQISYSEINAEIADGKLRLYMVEAHIAGGVNGGVSLKATMTPEEMELAIPVLGGGRYKEDEYGVVVDASLGAGGAGATIRNRENKDKEMALRGEIGITHIISAAGEISIKETDCTQVYKNDPKAVVNLLKTEVKALEEKSKVSILQKAGFIRPMSEKEQSETKEKIKQFNDIIEKINQNGLSDVM